MIHITLDQIVTGLILYGIIHGIYKLALSLIRCLESDTANIVRQHVKRDHSLPYKHCLIDECASLLQTFEHLPELHQQ